MSQCDEQILSAYFDGELPVRQRKAVEAHLLECPACAAQLEKLREVSHLMQDQPFEDITDAELRDLHNAVDSAIDQSADRSLFRIGSSIGLIAASVLIVGMAWLNQLPTTTNSTTTVQTGVAVSPPGSWDRMAITLRPAPLPVVGDVAPGVDVVAAADWMLQGLPPGAAGGNE